ncbi:B-cell receptor CD22-like [Salminus brasiliensis]|uniref:B-cell receptor CD22-like n=1 Tax=Salminus brasiliensis TaxID=930266 RepID=UPI003B83332D
MAPPPSLVFLLMVVESAQCCSVAAGVREERGEAVRYSNSDCLMGSSLCNQIFAASYVSGASGAEWSMNYNQQEICALKGSTVFMNGTFTLPENLTVTETYWVIYTEKNLNWRDLRENSNYSGRVEYFTDEQKHFSLKLSNVTKKDEHECFFRIKTDVEKQKYLGRPGVKLSVTELHVECPKKVTEGQSADLTCKTTCSLTDPTFIWYKNGRPLTTKTIKDNQLHLQTVSSEDAGRYSCAVRGSEHLPSTAQTLRVRYPPKSVSVSISSSGGIVEGSSVTLTCSSDANPPVKIYTWFKGSSSVGKGQTYSFANISSEDSGGYTCQSRNEHGERSSTAVYLNILYPPRNVTVFNISSGETVEGSSVNLTCSSDANPPSQNYTWFKEGGSSPVGSGHTYSPLQSGSYYCQAHNQHGAQRSAAMPVILNTEPHHSDHSVLLSATVGVIGVCGIAAFLIVVLWIRKKRRQDGNVEELVYVNFRCKSLPPDDDENSIPDYVNVPDLRKLD